MPPSAAVVRNMSGELPAATAFNLVVPLGEAAVAVAALAPKAVAEVKARVDTRPPPVVLVPFAVPGGVAGEPNAKAFVSVIGSSDVPKPPPLVFPESVIARPLVLSAVPLVDPGLLVIVTMFVIVTVFVLVPDTGTEFEPSASFPISENCIRAVRFPRSLSSPISIPGHFSKMNALPKAVVASGRNMKVNRRASC